MFATSHTQVVLTHPALLNTKQVLQNHVVQKKTVVKQSLMPKVQSKQHNLHVCHAEMSPRTAPEEVSPALKENLLGMLAGAFGLAWLASVLFPRVAMQAMFNLVPTDPVAKTTFVGFVAYLPVMAACLISLQSAAQTNKLGSDTFRNINLALMVVSGGVIMNCIATMGAIGDFSGIAIQAGMHAVVLLASVSGFGIQKEYSVVKQCQEFITALLKPTNFSSFMYGVVSITSLCGFYALAINTQTYILAGLSGAIEVSMQRGIGISCLLYAMVAAILKDAAEKGRLGESTFKNLNMGMILMALCSGLKFVWAYSEGVVMNQGALVSIEIATTIACIFFFAQLTAKTEQN
eukprot:TRINITY_DN1910_c0_g1_i8.p1 TRINITY_DN1910_c0_g1~~TRINITY_DN1910_c0_g1_i8.p1  ORF type:complete len:348 (+),score=61.94 TRINITY_DN1910_c0_g1_i8:141-1184(+)